jgi:hypothetical protein
MDLIRDLRRLMAAAALAALSACGGGDDAKGTAEGVYGGALSGSTYPAFQLLVLENGQYWALYGVQSSTSFGVAGFIQGTGASNGGAFTSSDGRDFGTSPPIPWSVDARYDSGAKSISGSLRAGAESIGFSGGPIAGSLYDYNVAASLASVAGAWQLTASNGEAVAVTVSGAGDFTAIGAGGCRFTGTFRPRGSGRNVFNVVAIFGQAPCLLAGEATEGIGVAYPLANGRTQLVVGVTTFARSAGLAAFGTR